MLSFLPNFYFESVTDIDIGFLQKYAVKAVLLDIDNTLSPHGAIVPYDGVCEWVNNLKNLGIKIAIISNNKEKRVRLFAENLKIKYYIANAKKPFKSGFILAKEMLDVDEKSILVVGDQIFTDILGANLAKMKSVLVEPKDKNEPFSIKLKRVFEVPLRFTSKIMCNKKSKGRNI